MGWNSARDIFDPIAQALIDTGAPDETKTRVLGDLIAKLQDEDWDTENESLDLFRSDPAIVEAFRQHGVTLTGDEDDEPPGGALAPLYRERAHLVALLASLFPSHIGYTDPNEPEWAVIIIDTPAGQLSWHVARSDMDLFAHVPVSLSTDRGWDGHSTEEKYKRVRNMTEFLNGMAYGRAIRAMSDDEITHLLDSDASPGQ